MGAAATSHTSTLARAWHVAAGAGLAVFALSTVLPLSPGTADVFNRWVYNALILLALAACLNRTRRRDAERAAWIALTVGVACWSVAEVLFDFAYGGTPPFPSVADAFYLAFYPCCYVGLMLLVRSQITKLPRLLWLDGATAALACAAFGAAVLFEVVLRTTDGSVGVIATNLAYPLGDILLLAAVVGVFAMTGWRPGRTWTLIGLALAATAIADAIFLFQSAAGTYAEGSIVDALWPASMLFLGAAAWRPARRLGVELEGRPLLATPLVCGVVSLGVLTYDHFDQLNLLAVGLSATTIAAVIVRTGLTFRENTRILDLMRVHAVTDALTGLGNRRRLLADLDRVLAPGPASEAKLLAIFDLDGFKQYNDTFGHPAGDALLARLAGRLEALVAPLGTAYRFGGDEFCALVDLAAVDAGSFLDAAVKALSEESEAFAISSSFGAVFLPDEAESSSDALHVADQRLYVQKRERSGRRAPHEVLLQALYERSPELRGHVDQVVAMAVAVGERLGVAGSDLEELALAARLHDVGKLAIPDAVLEKPGPLDVQEWAFIKEHVLIGERILAASPALKRVAAIVRHTHERWDGGGYVDGLAADQIPLAARIIAVCDAYSAMTSTRPYRLPAGPEQALDELRRCAGSQFDPDVVAAFLAVGTAPAKRRAERAA